VPLRVLPCGVPELERQLPGGGWPLACITEVIGSATGIGEVSLLLPALARLSGRGETVAWVAPPFVPYPPALQQAGVDTAQTLRGGRGRRRPMPCGRPNRALRSGTCGAVLGVAGQGRPHRSAAPATGGRRRAAPGARRRATAPAPAPPARPRAPRGRFRRSLPAAALCSSAVAASMVRSVLPHEAAGAWLAVALPDTDDADPQGLALWATRYSPLVSLCRHQRARRVGVVAEVAGSAHLFSVAARPGRRRTRGRKSSPARPMRPAPAHPPPAAPGAWPAAAPGLSGSTGAGVAPGAWPVCH
jgi:hypothetical protein